jgi:hypothetical protein
MEIVNLYRKDQLFVSFIFTDASQVDTNPDKLSVKNDRHLVRWE